MLACSYWFASALDRLRARRRPARGVQRAPRATGSSARPRTRPPPRSSWARCAAPTGFCRTITPLPTHRRPRGEPAWSTACVPLALCTPRAPWSAAVGLDRSTCAEHDDVGAPHDGPVRPRRGPARVVVLVGRRPRGPASRCARPSTRRPRLGHAADGHERRPGARRSTGAGCGGAFHVRGRHRAPGLPPAGRRDDLAGRRPPAGPTRRRASAPSS